MPKEKEVQEEWNIFVDGSVSKKGGGIGIILIYPNGSKIEHAEHLAFKVTNNQVEYEAILANLRIAKHLGIRKLTVDTNSQLIARQVEGAFDAKEPRMQLYLHVLKVATKGWESIKVKLINIMTNDEENKLSRIGATPCSTKGR